MAVCVYLSCNSIIPGRSSRTEKYLGACASGKWVLNKSYMEACRAKGSFVEVLVSQILLGVCVKGYM